MKSLMNRFNKFESIHQLSLSVALITFLGIMIVMLGLILTQNNIWSEIGLGTFLLFFLLNSFFITVVIINLIVRRNKLLETIYTIYTMLLNAPLALLMLFIYDYVNGKLIL